MKKEVQSYINGCEGCQKTKPINQKKQGLLKPHEIPDRPWDCITIDLITQLPKTTMGNDTIVVIIDKLTKFAIYQPLNSNNTIDGKRVAEVVLNRVVRIHGVPKKIISDRDTRFNSIFWKSLWQQLHTTLNMSTAYHPQTDGQTERQNRTLEQQLRNYVNIHHSDWDQYLMGLEIAYNDSIHSSTGYTPFELNNGQSPHLPIDLMTQPGQFIDNPTATERLKRLKEAIQSARENLLKAQQSQAKYANQHRREVIFKVDDLVLVTRESIRKDIKEQTPKLNELYMGPFKIIKVLSEVNYELDLSQTNLKIHNVFHVSRLKKYTDGLIEFPDRTMKNNRPPPEVIHDHEEFEVEEVLDKRTKRGGKYRKVIEYLIKWKGYDATETSWVELSNLTNAMEEVQEYEDRVNSTM